MNRLPDPFATRASGAGRSAEQTAGRLRGDAAQRWRRGAAGERQTAALLEPLRLAGWVVLHDRSVAGATANIDHLACDGRTLWILDTKVWRGKVTRLSDGQLWYADGPVAPRLNALHQLGIQAEVACRRHTRLAALAVRTLAVIQGAAIGDGSNKPAELIRQGELLKQLAAGASPRPSDEELELGLRAVFARQR